MENAQKKKFHLYFAVPSKADSAWSGRLNMITYWVIHHTVSLGVSYLILMSQKLS